MLEFITRLKTQHLETHWKLVLYQNIHLFIIVCSKTRASILSWSSSWHSWLRTSLKTFSFFYVGPPWQESSFYGHLANAFIFIISIYMFTIIMVDGATRRRLIRTTPFVRRTADCRSFDPSIQSFHSILRHKRKTKSCISPRRGSNPRPSSSTI